MQGIEKFYMKEKFKQQQQCPNTETNSKGKKTWTYCWKIKYVFPSAVTSESKHKLSAEAH